MSTLVIDHPFVPLIPSLAGALQSHTAALVLQYLYGLYHTKPGIHYQGERWVYASAKLIGSKIDRHYQTVHRATRRLVKLGLVRRQQLLLETNHEPDYCYQINEESVERLIATYVRPQPTRSPSQRLRSLHVPARSLPNNILSNESLRSQGSDHFDHPTQIPQPNLDLQNREENSQNSTEKPKSRLIKRREKIKALQVEQRQRRTEKQNTTVEQENDPIRREILHQIKNAVGTLTPGLMKLAGLFDLERILNAIAALREAQQGKRAIRNPGGWLYAAIVDGFKPNQSKPEQPPTQPYPTPGAMPTDRQALAQTLADRQLSRRLEEPAVTTATHWLTEPESAAPLPSSASPGGPPVSPSEGDPEPPAQVDPPGGKDNAAAMTCHPTPKPFKPDGGQQWFEGLEQWHSLAPPRSLADQNLPEPIDWSDAITAVKTAFLRLGWDKVQQAQFLTQHYGRNDTQYLTDDQILDCLQRLSGAGPGS